MLSVNCLRERGLQMKVQAVWSGRRRVSRVLCGKKTPARMKWKVYKIVVRPVVLYGLESVTLKKRRQAELEVVRFS